jgi:hypothetical protein
LLKERGYKVELFETLQTGYNNKVTDIQLASYGRSTQKIVRSGDVSSLREALECGMSTNACNKYGESLLHMICRRGNKALLEMMVEAGAVLQVSNDQGRTPLHDACRAIIPAFDVMNLLLRHDCSMLFMKDCQGDLPLSYVHIEDWDEWKNWLDENIDIFFPASKATTYRPSTFATMRQKSCLLQQNKTMELVKYQRGSNTDTVSCQTAGPSHFL